MTPWIYQGSKLWIWESHDAEEVWYHYGYISKRYAVYRMWKLAPTLPQKKIFRLIFLPQTAHLVPGKGLICNSQITLTHSINLMSWSFKNCRVVAIRKDITIMLMSAYFPQVQSHLFLCYFYTHTLKTSHWRSRNTHCSKADSIYKWTDNNGDLVVNNWLLWPLSFSKMKLHLQMWTSIMLGFPLWADSGLHMSMMNCQSSPHNTWTDHKAYITYIETRQGKANTWVKGRKCSLTEVNLAP